MDAAVRHRRARAAWSAAHALSTKRRGDTGLRAAALVVLMLACAAPEWGVAQMPTELDAIVVEADEQVQPATTFDNAGASTAVTRTEIERRQAGSVVELLQDLPGVDVTGGPRAGGTGITIRGFGSNEDVLVRVDGATRNFEKYRYGSGLTLDPELLRRVDVQRGVAGGRLGAGALGGVVRFETRSARDLLRPGRRYGARARIGMRSNNRSRELSWSAYAQPRPWLDVLLAGIGQDSGNYETPRDGRIPDSEDTQESALAKLRLGTKQTGVVDVSLRYQAEQGLEPFDATAGRPGIGGTVLRSSREHAAVVRYEGSPAELPVTLFGLAGLTNAEVTDRDSELAGGGTDVIGFDIFNWEAGVEGARSFGSVDVGATVGLQGERESRTSERRNDLRGSIDNDAQPPGTKTTLGGFAEIDASVGNFALTLGGRLDRFEVSAAASARRTLREQGRAPTASFTRPSATAKLAFTPGDGPLTIYTGVASAFRAPLVDEYFSAGSLSRCFYHDDFVAPPMAPRLTIAPGASVEVIAERVAAFERAQAAFVTERAAFEANPYANTNAVCGDRYQPETAVQYEAGLVYLADNLLVDGDEFTGRLVLYQTEVTDLLESIYQRASDGRVLQSGDERRRGLELELGYDAGRWFSSLALALFDGEVRYDYFRDTTNPLVAGGATAADAGWQPLDNAVGNSLSLTLGMREPGAGVEVGYRLRAVGPRRVTTGFKDGCDAGVFTIPTCFETSTTGSYATHAVFASWIPNDQLKVDISVENVANKRYRLNGFGGSRGTFAPGRDLRLSVRYAF